MLPGQRLGSQSLFPVRNADPAATFDAPGPGGFHGRINANISATAGTFANLRSSHVQRPPTVTPRTAPFAQDAAHSAGRLLAVCFSAAPSVAPVAGPLVPVARSRPAAESVGLGHPALPSCRVPQPGTPHLSHPEVVQQLQQRIAHRWNISAATLPALQVGPARKSLNLLPANLFKFLSFQCLALRAIRAKKFLRSVCRLFVACK